MSRYLDPTNDIAFKKLFRDKVRLIDLLNNILRLQDNYKIIELWFIPVEQMPLFIEGKRSIFDLKVQDGTGGWYIVEMQRKMHKDYLNRAQYYGCYSYVNQLEEGSKHNDLLPVVVISIIGTKAFPADVPCISYHYLKETTTQKQFLLSVSYVFIELGKFKEDNIRDDTDQWLHLLKCVSLEQEPPKEINKQCVLSAYENLEKSRWTKDEHDAYIRSKLAQEAEESEFEAKYEEGKAMGKAEGKAEGIEIGEARLRDAMAKEMLLDGEPIEKIIKFTKLTKEEIEGLK